MSMRARIRIGWCCEAVTAGSAHHLRKRYPSPKGIHAILNSDERICLYEL